MKKNLLAIICSLLLVTFAFSACGNNNESDKKSSDDISIEDVDDKVSDDDIEEDDEAEEAEIVSTEEFDEAYNDFLSTVIAGEYNAAQIMWDEIEEKYSKSFKKEIKELKAELLDEGIDTDDIDTSCNFINDKENLIDLINAEYYDDAQEAYNIMKEEYSSDYMKKIDKELRASGINPSDIAGSFEDEE